MSTLVDPEKVKFAFCDVESTGLDPNEDVILEVGITLTDEYLNVLISNSWLVKEEDWLQKFQGSVEEVREMHTNSGLIGELSRLPDTYEILFDGKKQTANYSPQYVALQIWMWFTKECGIPGGKLPMAGSTVSFDRSFLMRRMPLVLGCFGYRNIDVSSLKELCKVLNPDVYSAMADDPRFHKSNARHRVRNDIQATIEELQFYIDHFLFVEIPPEEVDGQMELTLKEPLDLKSPF